MRTKDQELLEMGSTESGNETVREQVIAGS